MTNSIEKFSRVSKEQGLGVALHKTVPYLAFLLRKSNLERIWKKAYLKAGSLEIRGWNTGLKIYWDNNELTKGIGLNTAIFVNGKWHDSSKADWKVKEVKGDRLVLDNVWATLPISQTWTISMTNNERIRCEITLDAQEDVELVEQKILIMLPEKYNKWSDAGNKSMVLPQFKDWADISQVKKDSAFISAESDIDKNLPKVTLRKLDSNRKVYAQIQNSDFKTRLLNFVASSKDASLKYKKGINEFFNVEIEIR